MRTTTLQVPLSKDLKKDATEVAREYGFSSLQEVVRVFLTKLSKKELIVGIREESVVRLSRKAEARYAKMDEDFKEGRNVHSAKDIDDLMSQLTS